MGSLKKSVCISVIFLLTQIFALIAGCAITAEPAVWIGDEDDETYCMAKPSDCSRFGLDFACEDPAGGTLPPCINGTKVMCLSPSVVIADDPTPASEIHVVTYNIWELRYLYYQNGQRERTCRIMKELFTLRQDIDVIVFNEAFMGGCFAKFNTTVEMSTLTIRDMLVQYGFNYYTKTVGEVREVPPKFENGGVFIASKWPITAEAETIYTEAVIPSEDYLSAKGAKYARVVKAVDGKIRPYNIFGSHMQASKGEEAERVRVSQASEMYALAQSLNLPKNEPIIYAGDFNVDYYDKAPSHSANVLNALHAIVPPIIGELNFTTDGALNDARDGNSESFKDYVIYDRDHFHPMTATQEILRPRAPEFFEVCMQALSPYPTYPESEKCRMRQNITDLSDHFPVIGVYQFGDDMVMTTESEVVMTTESDLGATTDSGAIRFSAQQFMTVFTMMALIFGSYQSRF